MSECTLIPLFSWDFRMLQIASCKLPTNCLSVFGHLVNLALKGLSWFAFEVQDCGFSNF